MQKSKQNLEIKKILTISDNHVTKKTYEALVNDGVKNEIMLPVYTKTAPGGDDYGIYIYISKDCFCMDNIPNDLKPLIKLAMEYKCDILCLDCDGQELEDYPTYDR